MLQAYFPSPKLPDSTVSVWAQELLPFDYAVGMEAVRLVGQEGTGGRPVQIADVLASAKSSLRHQNTPDLTHRNELADVKGIDPASQAILDAYRKKFA